MKETLSYLSPDLEIEGTITCKGPIRIDAQVQGKIEAMQQVNIGTPAVIHGPIQASNLIVDGTITGDLHISENIAVLSKAHIEGNIYTSTGKLSVVKGCYLKGKLEVGRPKISRDKAV